MHRFGLIVVGDEVLSGRKQDVHLSYVIGLLGRFGQELAWARYLSDDPDELVSAFKDSFASGDIVFVTGGIGATPDDRTRQSSAKALGLPLVGHPEGVENLRAIFSGDRWSEEEWPNRQQMAFFPEGSDLIPNPVNKVAGFSIAKHFFVPGFPKMAHPMLEWVIETQFKQLPSNQPVQWACHVRGTYESQITPLLESIESQFEGVKSFSLPSNDDPGLIEVGVKGRGNLAEPADMLKQGLLGFTSDLIEL